VDRSVTTQRHIGFHNLHGDHENHNQPSSYRIRGSQGSTLRAPNKTSRHTRQQMSEQASDRNAWCTSTHRSCRMRNLRKRVANPRFAR
jgi:hypothetical protein